MTFNEAHKIRVEAEAHGFNRGIVIGLIIGVTVTVFIWGICS